MKTALRLTIALGLFASAGCGAAQAAATNATSTAENAAHEAEAPLAMISVDDVQAAVESHDANTVIFDANHRETYDQHHVPGATWISYDTVSATTMPADHAKRLVFYCANEQCGASHTAARAAKALGYENVFVMGAGIQGWIAAGKAVESAH